MLPNAVERRLNSIPNLSRQGKQINGLFRLLESPLLWQDAYESIATNKGALTQGVNGDTLDGFSLETIQQIIIQLKNGTYRFKPVRRVYIPKSNGKTRPLGIPTASDKLVQSAVKILLELIYEPVFSRRSHGFRQQRSCHTALKEIKDTWTSVKWFVEVDIAGYFDNIDHDILINLLKKKIEDKRFISLIEQMLKAGYLEDWTFKPTFSGTPQGGVISPILANIYLHELDVYMQERVADFTKGKYRKMYPPYTRLSGKIGRLRREVDKLKANQQTQEAEVLKKEIRTLEKERRKLPSKDWMDPNFRRLRYCRYADDFLIGIIGSKAEAIEEMAKIKEFLEQKLSLSISKEKSGISKSREGVTFLGYRVYAWKSNWTTRTRLRGRAVTRRFPTDYIQLRAPVEKLAKFVEKKGYGNYHSMKSKHRGRLIENSDAEIIMAYNAELRGLANFYQLATLWKHDLGRVSHVWWFSLMKTLAAKHRSTVKRTASRLRKGNDHVIHYVVNKKPKQCRVFKLKFLNSRPIFSPNVDLEPSIGWHLGRSEIIERLNAKQCEACGASGIPMEVHHTRKLADMKQARILKKVKAARKRKRIVLCRPCHRAIHQGKMHDMRQKEFPDKESRMR